MAQLSANVRKWSAASLWVAPTGTAAPTSHSGALNVAFTDLGYGAEDAIEEAQDRSTDDIKTVGGVTVRKVITDSSLTYAIRLLETRKEAIELYYGSTVVAATGLVNVNPAETGGQKSFVFDFTDGTAIKRVYIATGEVTEVESLPTDEAVYGLTITAYPVAGVAAKIWISTLIV